MTAPRWRRESPRCRPVRTARGGGGETIRTEFTAKYRNVRAEPVGVGSVSRRRGGAGSERAVQHRGLLVCIQTDQQVDDMPQRDPLLGPAACLTPVIDGLAEQTERLLRITVPGVQRAGRHGRNPGHESVPCGAGCHHGAIQRLPRPVGLLVEQRLTKGVVGPRERGRVGDLYRVPSCGAASAARAAQE